MTLREDRYKLLSKGATKRLCTMGHVRNQVYSALCGHLGALSFGYMIGYSSPALPKIESDRIFASNSSSASWFSSIATLGAVIGCLLAGWLVEQRGRRATLMLSAVPFIAGWLCIGVGEMVEVMCMGRFLTGIGSGAVLVSAPLYVAETASKDLRGALGAGVQLSVAFGILLVYALGLVLTWRMLALAGMLIPLVAVGMAARAPESPRFLLDVGRREEAVVMLTWLRGSSAAGEEEVRDMEESSSSTASRATLREIISQSELLRPLTIAVMIMIFQQLSGINVVMFYTVSIFESAGFKESGGIATVIIGIVQVIGTVAACLMMDRFGRRRLLTVAGLGMAISCLALGICDKITSAQQSASTIWSWMALVSLIGYILAFAVGWGPIPMLLMSEIIPARARGPASAIASTTNWVFAFMVTGSFMQMKNLLGLYGSFWMFGGFCLTAVIYVQRKVPETKGKSLEDIELCFVGQAPLMNA